MIVTVVSTTIILLLTSVFTIAMTIMMMVNYSDCGSAKHIPASLVLLSVLLLLLLLLMLLRLGLLLLRRRLHYRYHYRYAFPLLLLLLFFISYHYYYNPYDYFYCYCCSTISSSAYISFRTLFPLLLLRSPLLLYNTNICFRIPA